MIQREKVLLVDDDPALLESMEAVLADQFEVRTCTSARVALYFMAREPFHVVCSDWHMPEMNGLQLYRAILSSGFRFQPSFVLISAHAADLMDPEFQQESDAIAFLRKPFAPLDLVHRIDQSAGLAKLKSSTGKIRLPSS
jgi:DNA-binding NtrC family response regulator